MEELIRKLADNGDEVYGQPCTVESINGLLAVCQPVNGDAEIHDVRLVADDVSELFILVPAVGSIVIVEFLNKDEAYISMVSKVSEVKYTIAGVVYRVTDQGFLLQKGNDTLKQVLTMIVEAVEQIVVVMGNPPDYVKLQNVLLKINNLLQ